MASTVTVGSGLGGFTAIAAQPTYGGTWVPPTRPIYGLKSNKATHDPHIVQGGPYLEYGRVIDIGAAHVQTYTDAKGTLVCDAMSSGLALLLASSFGSASQLVAMGSAPAFELGNLRPEAAESHNGVLWSATQEYLNTGEVVLEGTTFYENIKATGNLNKKPSTEATFWTAIAAYAGGTTYAAGAKAIETPAGGKPVVYTSLAAGNKGNTPISHPESWQPNAAQSGFCFDMQLGVPTTAGELTPWNYHSCVITKAELVFERTGLVACTFDWDAQSVDNTEALITPTMSTSAEPFAMGSASSVFKVGPVGAPVTIPGMRKFTVTLEHKYALDRVYLGEAKKQSPSSNGLIDITCVAETDYTLQAKKVLETFLKNEPQAITATAVGAKIGTSTESNTIETQVTNAFINSGGEAPLDGPDIVKNSVTFKATINASNESAVKAKLITADTTF